MTIRHVVIFQWVEELPPGHVDDVCSALAELPAQIPELVSYQFGPDLGLADGNAAFAVVADFASADGFRTYRDHRAHQAFIADFISGFIASRTAVQFELRG